MLTGYLHIWHIPCNIIFNIDNIILKDNRDFNIPGGRYMYLRFAKSSEAVRKIKLVGTKCDWYGIQLQKWQIYKLIIDFFY